MASGSALPAASMPAAMVMMPSWPRKPSVSPAKLWPRFFHSLTNLTATSGLGADSGNQGAKNSRWLLPSAAAPAWAIS